jgi:RimJ/RimL family protein N-acetyltransferase
MVGPMADPSVEQITGRGLVLSFHLAPWDRAVLNGESAVLSEVRLVDPNFASGDLAQFNSWCVSHGVILVTARLPHESLLEAGLLEAHGFRFVELNYRPFMRDLSGFAADADFLVRQARAEDAAIIVGIASKIFSAGRFHMDPAIGCDFGNRRYALWAERAFSNPAQEVIVCEVKGRLAAFMVIESPRPEAREWSLVGLAPDLIGRGYGGRIWRAILAHHASEGVTEVSTSISSFNLAAHNLYVSLGFRFPTPKMIFHWHPRAKLMARVS